METACAERMIDTEGISKDCRLERKISRISTDRGQGDEAGTDRKTFI